MTLETGTDWLVLTISNDCHRTDLAEWPVNAGRSNMRARTEELGGNLIWRARTPDQGTAWLDVVVRLPLARGAPR
jgi:signal transduction histidine kinase